MINMSWNSLGYYAFTVSTREAIKGEDYGCQGRPIFFQLLQTFSLCLQMAATPTVTKEVAMQSYD